MPEKVLKKINQSILPQWKVCFFSALVVGLIAHFYKFTNWLPNWDSLVFRYDPQNMIHLGRWFLPVACAPSSFYDLPFLNGFLAIIFHAIGAVCICKILDIKKNITAFLIGATVVSFPTVTSVMMYNYVADGYSIAFLLACIAALLMTTEKPKYHISVILIALSVGIYQAYVTVTVILLILHLTDLLIFRKSKITHIIKKTCLCLLSGFLGMLLYYGVLKFILLISGTALAEYQGINSTASLFNLDILGSLYSVKETLLTWFFDFSKGINIFILLNIIIFAVSIVAYLINAIKSGVFSSFLKAIYFIILALFIAVGGNLLAFINAEADYHNLMLMGYIIFYLFFIMLYEKGNIKKDKVIAFKSWLVLCITLVLIFNQIVIANVSYHKAQLAYEKSYGVLIRIADRIEETSGSDECDKLLVIGALKDSEAYSVNLPPDMTGITDGYIIRADDESVGQSVLCSALNDYCNKSYTFISGETKKALLEKEEIKSTNTWPGDNSIITFDGVIVIKLGAESDSK